jgi:hypothetical protein
MESKGRGATIHFTTDGSVPTTGSPRYNGEVSFTSPATVAVRAFRKGIQSDAVARVEVAPSLSTGRPLRLANQFSARYSAGGPDALVDGLKGSQDYRDGFWQGYEGVDLDAVIDLGEVRPINHVKARFLQDTPMWIFYPSAVECAVSSDGITFVRVGRSEQPVASWHQERSMKEVSHQLTGVQARYVRMRAISVGVCPPWHAGAGGKAWTFCDEITVE